MKFWLEDPKELFKNSKIFPNSSMTEIEKLNTLTRLIILISILLLIFKIGSWLTFLILGLGLVILLYYYNKQSTNIENFSCRSVYLRPKLTKYSSKTIQQVKYCHRKWKN